MDERELKQFLLECEQKLTTHPDDVDAQYGMAAALNLLGRYDEALPRFERVLRREPTLVTALDGLGVCLHKQGRLEDAYTMFQKALKDCESPDIYANLGDVLAAMGRTEEAVAAYEAGLAVALPGEESSSRLAASLSALLCQE